MVVLEGAWRQGHGCNTDRGGDAEGVDDVGGEGREKRKDVVVGVENGPWLEKVVALHSVVVVVRVDIAREVEVETSMSPVGGRRGRQMVRHKRDLVTPYRWNFRREYQHPERERSECSCHHRAKHLHECRVDA